MVVSNAVAALSDISEASTSGLSILDMSPSSLNKMLTALNECSEWGQVFILDALSSNYSPRDEREAQATCERIVPRLAHANPAVVLSSVKLLMKFMAVLCQAGTLFNHEELSSYHYPNVESC